MSDHGLTHLDRSGQPQMVDVTAKPVTARAATAEATIVFPPSTWDQLQAGGFATGKGPVCEVARVAGTTAIKQTAQLIPFCHPLPIDGCEFTIEPLAETRSLRIRCTVRCTARTGVEMEALTGASVAALTVYDMTKSLGHDTVIEQVKLIAKSGGQQDFNRDD